MQWIASAARGLAVGAHDLPDALTGHRRRRGSGARTGHGRRRLRRTADGLRVRGAPGVIEVGEGKRTVIVDRLHDVPQAGDGVVAGGPELLRVLLAEGIDVQRLHDDEPRSSGGAAAVVLDVPAAGAAVPAPQGRLDRRQGDAVGQRSAAGQGCHGVV